MMDEIRLLHDTLNPVETLFVVDAMQGQDAVNTAKAFSETLPLTGVVLTKLDGDSRGGAALSVKAITGKPIKFVGVGEKLTGLDVFHPDRMANRILGMGDIVALVEQAQANVDHEAAAELASKFKSGAGFDLNDFLAQISQMKKLGGLSSLMEKMPAEIQGKATAQDMDKAERDMRRMQGIIHAMTPAERHKPELIKAPASAASPPAPAWRARGQPAAQPVLADAVGHEEDAEGRPGQNDARHEGHEGPDGRRRHAGHGGLKHSLAQKQAAVTP